MLKKFKRYFGIAAPRVAVHTHHSWYWRWLALGIIVALFLGFAWSAYDVGGKLAGFDRGQAQREIDRLAGTNDDLQRENGELRTSLTKAERQLEIERITHADLAKQIKLLTEEGSELKEDLAFFQTLMQAGVKGSGLSINRFRVQKDVLPGEYRYRLLLLQADQRAAEFKGNLQLLVQVEQDGKASVLSLPPVNEKGLPPYKLGFKFFQRIEGRFQVAPEVAVTGLQIRVFEDGIAEPKLSKSFNL